MNHHVSSCIISKMSNKTFSANELSKNAVGELAFRPCAHNVIQPNLHALSFVDHFVFFSKEFQIFLRD